MDIWLLVVILLAIAIILFVVALFMKDGGHLQEQLDELTVQQSQELYQMKTRIAELEKGYRNQGEAQTSSRTTNVALEPQDEQEVALEDLSQLTKDEIIKLYSQGYTMQEISHSVALKPETIQVVVDDYIENR